MPEQEAYNLNNQEELILLNEKDKPLSPEQVDDLEGPIDNNMPLQLPNFIVVKKELMLRGLEVIGERESCSGGAFGPLFKIKVRDQKSGEERYILERTFTEIKDVERRFSLLEKTPKEEAPDSSPRYKIINHQNKDKNKLVIDYLYNEEKALKDLQELKGIPRFYGAVYDDLIGSTLEEFIDGYDLSLVLILDKKISQSSLVAILNKVKATYIQAAQLGYVHGDPGGSTIMIDNNNEPYLTDWYLYSFGSIENDQEVKKRYLEGLEKISWLQQRILAESN